MVVTLPNYPVSQSKQGAGILIRVLKPSRSPNSKKGGDNEPEANDIHRHHRDEKPALRPVHGDNCFVHYRCVLEVDDNGDNRGGNADDGNDRSRSHQDGNQAERSGAGQGPETEHNDGGGDDDHCSDDDDQYEREKEVVIDDTRERDQPLEFRLGAHHVIQGLEVAVQRMHLGQQVEVTVPYPFAYGERGNPPEIPPNATIVFQELELVRINDVRA